MKWGWKVGHSFANVEMSEPKKPKCHHVTKKVCHPVTKVVEEVHPVEKCTDLPEQCTHNTKQVQAL